VQIFIEQGKGSKDRYILFPESFRLILQSHLAANPKNRYLFESRQRRKYTARRVQQIVADYARAAGLPERVHQHLLRHQMLTWLTAKGLPGAEIQLISGHASKKSLEVYQHLSLAHVAPAYQRERIGDLIWSLSGPEEPEDRTTSPPNGNCTPQVCQNPVPEAL
jgi:site-specific recombinase XerD